MLNPIKSKQEQTTLETTKTEKVTTKQKQEQMQKIKKLADAIEKQGLTPIAQALTTPLGLSLSGAKKAILRTIKKIDTPAHANKVLVAYEAAKNEVKSAPTKTTSRTGGNYRGGSMTNKLPQGEQETLKKQATIIRQYLTQEKVAIWEIAEETYKAMGMPTRKMAASRIYRALNLSGYVENIAPVLDFLSKHVAQVTLSKKALKPVNVKAQSVAFAPETTTAPLSTTKHCNGTSETYLKEIRDAITSGRWTMKDAIKLASTVVPTGAKMLPGAFFTTMATLITHPDTIQLFAETEYSTWLEKAITRTWESIPQQSSALRNTMKELMGGFEKLTKLIHEI